MKNKKLVAIIAAIGIGTFMSSLDSSVVNLVMPLIKNYFGVSLSIAEWIVTAYLIVVSSLLLTFGRISDIYGQKRVYLTGLIIFVAGSLLCGLSIHISMLIACRVIQAIGAGMLFSTGAAIITDCVPATSRGKALSVVSVSVALGLCAGPVVGGILSSFFDWQSIFFINVPIGVLGIIIVIKSIPADEKKEKGSFDILGSILIFIGLLFILIPLSISGDYDISFSILAALIFIGILIIGFFVVFETKCENPMLKIGLFKNRVFAASNAAVLFIFMAEFIAIFLVPFYLENLRMYSALISGILYLPMPIATMLVAPISGSLSDHYDSRYISSAGTLIMSIGLFMLSFLKVNTPFGYIITSMTVVGIGFGMFQTPNNSAIMGNVPKENRGTASGTLATMRNIGMAIGVATSAALFSLYEGKANIIYSSVGQTDVILKNNVFIYGLHRTLIISSTLALVATATSLIKGRVKTEDEKMAEMVVKIGKCD